MATACEQVSFGDQSLNNIAYRCQATNSAHEPTLRFSWPTDDHTYLRVLSDKAGARFRRDSVQASAELANQPAPDYLIELRADHRLQEVTGYGGAFTDSASQVIGELPEQVRERLLEDYFGQDGLDYNMGRVPIGGTDMSSRPYSYDDLAAGEQDLELRHFRLQAEDLRYKIPLLQRINSMRHRRHQTPLKLMAASWSAPAWMKSNNNLVQGRLRGDSSQPYYEAYARYVIRFLEEYERHNLSMWALTPQNEPLTPKRVGPFKINFNSVNFEPHEMVDYLEHNLVPALLRANRTADKLNLYLWDDTLDGLDVYQAAALKAPRVREFARGLALHWYSQGLHEISYRHLYDARRQLPGQYSMLSTEASFIGRPKPGDWARGQRYARDIIENLRAGSVGWLDWNLALNMSGGPTWSHNYLDSAILVDTEREAYYRQPMYYALGHLSRFIRAGAHVVPTSIWAAGQAEPMQTGSLQDEIAVVAAELGESSQPTPGHLKRQFAVVYLNRVAWPRHVQMNLRACRAKLGQPGLRLELPANSITSLAFLC